MGRLVRPRLLILLPALLSFTATPARAEPGDELSASIITIEPGDAVFEKFAHNMIWLRDESSGESIAYNWGMFTFEEENFFVNFLRGRLNYWMQGDPAEDVVRWYIGENRSVWVQELNLGAAQKLKLRDALRRNDTDENRHYLYNYYTDNCSTRVRDALDSALDGQIKSQLEPKPTGTTFRWHTRRLTRDSVGWYTALNTVLGPKTDVPISAWDECFLPVKLMEHLPTVTVRDAQGSTVPLVARERIVFTGTRPPEPVAPPNWVLHYFAVGAGIAAGLIALAGWAARGRWGRITIGVIATSLAAMLGLCGLFGMWAWFFSAHWSAWRNENLFGYSPLAFVLAFFIPPMVRGRLAEGRIALALAAVLAASAVIGVIAGPMLPQASGEPMALALPLTLGLAYAVRLTARQAARVAALTKPDRSSDKGAS